MKKIDSIKSKNIINIIIFFILVLVQSCQSESIESYLKDEYLAKDNLPSIIEHKKIIFLAETHNVINPILFLTENLEMFYDSGVRHIVFEGANAPELYEQHDYYFYPWLSTGWKLEGKILKDKIKDFNLNKPFEDQIHIIYGENEFNFSKEVNSKNLKDYFQERDQFIFKKIDTLVERIPSKDKVLVFYGESHGSKVIWKDFKMDNSELFDWKPFGFYLKNKYLNQYISLQYINIYKLSKNLKGRKETSIINYELFNKSDFHDKHQYFDYYLIDKYAQYGTNYQYDYSKENILKMISKIEFLINSSSKPRTNFHRAEDNGQILLILYYLKLYFGDNFKYSLWNPTTDLQEELSNLKDAILNNENDYLNLFQINIDGLNNIRSYSGALYNALPSYYDINSIWFLNNLRVNSINAIETFPEDLWGQYYYALSYIIEKKYENARILLKEILDNDLIYSIEIFPIIINQYLYCCEKTNSNIEKLKYISILESLETEYGSINYHCYDLEVILKVLKLKE